MKKLFLIVIVTFLTSFPLGATNYYVSPTGGDSNDGLTEGAAWLSLDNGDQTSVLLPGDTVFILGGTYLPSATYLFNTDGTAENPIVYRAYANDAVLIDIGDQPLVGITVEGNHVKIENLEVFNSALHGLLIKSDSTAVYGCHVHDIDSSGVIIEGSYNLILRNTVRIISDHGINNRNTGINNRFYGNTVYDIQKGGIEFQQGVSTGRVFNNIVVGSDNGINAKIENICGFNLLWNNNNDYNDGCLDSAGGILADPLFYDTAAGNFALRYNSPAINSGLDLGYDYNQTAPEMGAVEIYNHYYVSLAGDDNADGLTEATAWATIDNGDADRYDILIPGDTVSILAGTYIIDAAVYLSTSGGYEQPVVYRAYGIDTVQVDMGGQSNDGIIVAGNHNIIENLEITNSSEDGIFITADSVTVQGCYIHDFNKDGIRIEGSEVLILRNRASANSGHGINNRDSGLNNKIYNNTIYGNGNNGIETQGSVVTLRIFNNIIELNDKGINADIANICGYNCLWNNSTDYAGGCVDFAGGISVDPLFTDAVSGDFTLQAGSPVIDQGLDLGYDYQPPAPDMGALEAVSILLAYVQIELFDGSPVPDSLNTDIDTIVLYCRGYTGISTLLGDYAATWSIIGADSIGTVTPGPATSTSLTLTNIGTGQIIAEFSPTMIDTTGVIACLSGSPVGLTVIPDSATVSADSTLQFNSISLDADGNTSNPGIIPAWSVLGGIGTIDEFGLFTATTAGEGYIVASGMGLTDTVGPITVVPGDLVTLEVIPDSVDISADSTLLFEAVGRDDDNNITDAGTITWELIGAIGSIDVTGLFTPDEVGTGQIAATSSIGGLVDTNTLVTVIPGTLVRLVISPDLAVVNMSDSIQFTAVGYDADSNLTNIGDLTWKVVGRVGDIDNAGLFIADRPGTGLISSVSSINDITDTTGFIDVEELYISVVPMGTGTAAPSQADAPVLTFRIDNYYDEAKSVTAFTVRDASRGEGDAADKITNVDSVAVYLDTDNDSLLSGGDVLLAKEEYNSYNINLSIAPQTIPADEGLTFIVSASVALYPHDSDSLDMYLLSATDVATGDGTPLAGADSVNSFGYTVYDGMTANQIGVNATGTALMEPGETIYPVLDFTLPRNGYSADTLKIFSFINEGTAAPDDFDSLMLFKDDGDNIFESDLSDSYLGKITYTGSRWSISGLEIPLEDETNHFYVGASISDYPTSGTTVTFSIPVGGVEMASYNDGPMDMAVTAVDTIVIQTSEAIEIKVRTIPSEALIPGEITSALLGFELINSYVDSVRIDSFRCFLQAVDADGATQAELDSQVDSLLLYASVNNAAETVVASGYLVDGEAVFVLEDISVAGSGGLVDFSIAAGLNAFNCKNDNLLNITIDDSLDLYFDSPMTVDGLFPLQNEDDFPIDAFPAGNITVNSVDELTHFGGQVDRVVFDFALPGNGYAADVLSGLQLQNLGNLDEVKTIDNMYLWADITGDGISADDSLLDQFKLNQDIWWLSNIQYSIPSGGARFYVTIDIAIESFTAGTMQLSLLEGEILYESGMNGPDDFAVTSPQTHLIFPSNRVTAISFPQLTSNIFPGSSDNLILTFALYNSYLTQNQNLQALTLTNMTRSASDIEFADQALGQVSLFYDKDKNRVYGDDSLISTGYFSEGILKMSGLDVILPPESLSYFFVLVDLPLKQIDSDSLMVAIANPSDFVFKGAVNVNGDLPLTRGGYLVIDGSVFRQYHIQPLSARTLSPGDTSVSLFTFHPAYNGDQADILTSLTVNNLEDADETDISVLELWLDANGDSLWQDSDSMLGTFSYGGLLWTLTGLDIAVDSNPPFLMVLGDISLTATPNVAFRPEIPLNGCQYSSANDGPLDLPLAGSIVFPVSTSSMRVTYTPLKPTYSVGQDIDLRITVSNILTDSIKGIQSEIVDISNPALISLFDSLTGPLDLAGGESVEFYYEYSAQSPGPVSWQMRAISGDLPDTSVIIQTEPTVIQTVPQDVLVNLFNNMPTSVTRGQENVFPMSLRVNHSDTLAQEASLRLDSIIVNVEDISGQPLYADEVFSSIVVSGGYEILAAVNIMPHLSSISLVFQSPVIIPVDEEINLTFLVNIDSLASADDFVLAFTDAGNIPIYDNNTLVAVTIDPGIIFPLKTEACRIDEPSRQMMISYTSLLNEYVNIHQYNVPVLNLTLRHPEAAGSSQIQLMSFKMLFVDSLHNPVIPSQLVERVLLKKQQTVIGEVNDLGTGADSVDMQLSMPVTLNPGEIDSLTLEVDVKDIVGYSGFGLVIPDSTIFTVRDLSSGSSLEMATDTTMLATGSVFPITSGWAQLKQTAMPLEVCVSSALPGSTTGGRDSLTLINIDIAYDVDDSYSPVNLKAFMISVHDSLGMAYDPDRLFDRIGYRIDGGEIEYEMSEEIIGNVILFELGADGLQVNPGDNLSVQLVCDIEADVPYDHFTLSMPFENNIVLTDATDTTLVPGVTLAAGCAGGFPFITGTTNIYLPAGRPVLKAVSWPVQNAFLGQDAVTLFNWQLIYDSQPLEGELLINELSGLLLKRGGQGLIEAGGNSVFDEVYLMIDDEIVARDSILTGGSLNLMPDEAYTMARGDSLELSLKAAVKTDATLGNYVLMFEDSTFVDITDKNLLTPVYQELDNGVYPLYSVEIALSLLDLGHSFVNYPNPFVPSRGEVTTISYNLVEDAYVDIELFTITGEAVSDIAVNAFRSQGVHQSDTWAGLNDKGRRVVAGTYFCRITARYVSGREESFRRKIAVIR